VAERLDRAGGEPDHVLARGRDRVRDRRREEPRGGRAEHAEERVHEDLDRLRRDRVAAAARAPARPRARDQLRQDAGLVAPERRAAGRADDVGASAGAWVSGSTLKVRMMLG
jgi:hypothetical protein